MISGEKDRQPASAETALDLSDLVTALAEAVLGAKRRLDEDAVALAKKYRANPLLRFLPPPSFAIGEVRVVIKLAIAQIKRSTSAARSARRSHLYVHVDTPTLHDLAPHLISEIELRITSEMTRTPSMEDEPTTSE